MKSSGWKYKREDDALKYLIVCDGGNVRSAALATTLKLDYGQEAIAVGRLYMSSETMVMLSNWADRIILMQAHMIESIPDFNQNKCGVADVGQDRWGIYIHPELNELVNNIAAELEKEKVHG